MNHRQIALMDRKGEGPCDIMVPEGDMFLPTARIARSIAGAVIKFFPMTWPARLARMKFRLSATQWLCPRPEGRLILPDEYEGKISFHRSRTFRTGTLLWLVARRWIREERALPSKTSLP